MTYDFPPADYFPWLHLWINVLIMLPILLWGVGLFRRNEESYATEPSKRFRWFTAILISFSGLSFLPFFMVLPVALGGRLMEQSRKNPLPFVILAVLPMFLYCFSNWYVFAGSREAATRTNCRKNLKQIGTIFDDYHEAQGHFPSTSSPTTEGHQVSWRVEASKWLHELQNGYDPSATWDSPANQPLLQQKPDFLYCVTHKNVGIDESASHTSYALVTGEGTINPPSGPLSREEITDGVSNTIMTGEVAGLQIPWTEPRDIDIDQQPIGINLPGDQPHQSPGWFSSYHQNGAFFQMANGSVQWFSKNTDPKILRALVTANEDEEEPWATSLIDGLRY
ncbi:hypothetical protein Pla110_16730 [Polystyrenella longa]|uniref:DUF1559 domain-containing protein n=1 Tax=Polystyrenella longa TaxID=2528007 RepID=A0A518CL54_9PLAN|nr:DUF1559 domain-containing protein [Polystyrenella longa]QDU79951.1 hypothetical protein Pla110_16730 [Polystyrenella longa]